MFEDSDIIYAYTWDDACEDGSKVNVSGLAAKAGFCYPVAITRSLFELLSTSPSMNLNDVMIDIRVTTFLMLLAIHVKHLKETGKAETNRIKYHATLSDDEDGVTETWVSIEARSPKNPEPVMTIMLPSDY